MWHILTSDAYSSELQGLLRKHGKETKAAMANAFHYVESLSKVKKPETFLPEYVKHSSSGIYSVAKGELCPEGDDIRFVLYPEFGKRVVHFLGVTKGIPDDSDKEYTNYIQSLG